MPLKFWQSAYRLDVSSAHGGEWRTQSFSYVTDRLVVLSVVHTGRADALRAISFRFASEKEPETYHEWLSQDGS